jgi:hypothetical protein
MAQNLTFAETLKVVSNALVLMTDNKNVMNRLADYIYRTKIATAIKNVEPPAKERSTGLQKPYNPYSPRNYK